MPMEHGASASVCSDRCDVLLDTTLYFGYRRNKTTAAAWTSTGHAVEVSIVLAEPPAFSRCFIHCDGLTAEQFTTEPQVIRSEGAFLLLRMAFRPSTNARPVNDVFVYRPGSRKPLLYLLPHSFPPPPLHSNSIALLPSDGEHFRVVIPTGWFNRDPVLYNLDIFSSNSKLWTTIQIPVSVDAKDYFKLVDHQTSKVISLGGGFLGWVDLWQGILICDMLADEPVMSLMRFPGPEPEASNKLICERQFDLHSARAIRDVTYSNGVVRFVEIEYHQNCNIKGCGGWVATMWRREVSAEDWSPCWKIDSSDISATSSLPSDVCDIEKNKLNLNKVISTCPTLHLHDHRVLYLLSKLNPEDPIKFVLAINTESKTLEGIANVSGERIYIDLIFSNYISSIPGTELSNQQITTRENMESVETNLMAVINGLKDFERLLKHQTTEYSRILPLLHSTMQSTASSSRQSKDASRAVDNCLRLSTDLKPRVLAPIDSMKNKTRVTIGTLHNLMQTLGVEAESVGLHKTAG